MYFNYIHQLSHILPDAPHLSNPFNFMFHICLSVRLPVCLSLSISLSLLLNPICAAEIFLVVGPTLDNEPTRGHTLNENQCLSQQLYLTTTPKVEAGNFSLA